MIVKKVYKLGDDMKDCSLFNDLEDEECLRGNNKTRMGS